MEELRLSQENKQLQIKIQQQLELNLQNQTKQLEVIQGRVLEGPWNPFLITHSPSPCYILLSKQPKNLS